MARTRRDGLPGRAPLQAEHPAGRSALRVQVPALREHKRALRRAPHWLPEGRPSLRMEAQDKSHGRRRVHEHPKVEYCRRPEDRNGLPRPCDERQHDQDHEEVFLHRKESCE